MFFSSPRKWEPERGKIYAGAITLSFLPPLVQTVVAEYKKTLGRKETMRRKMTVLNFFKIGKY
jgi:hypothetical protein